MISIEHGAIMNRLIKFEISKLEYARGTVDSFSIIVFPLYLPLQFSVRGNLNLISAE